MTEKDLVEACNALEDLLHENRGMESALAAERAKVERLRDRFYELVGIFNTDSDLAARPHCRDCADSDGFCFDDGRNCGFAKGHPLYRSEPFRPAPPPSPSPVEPSPDPTRAKNAQVAPSPVEKVRGVYVASRASVPERSAMWRRLRDAGHGITSSWIDEAGEGEIVDFSELWGRITREIAQSEKLVLYAEPGDFPLKGALIEVGIALGMGKPVVVCLPGVKLDGRTSRPVGSWIAHRRVVRIDNITQALCSAAPPAPLRESPAQQAGTGELADVLTKRRITHDEAREAVQRLVNFALPSRTKGPLRHSRAS